VAGRYRSGVFTYIPEDGGPLQTSATLNSSTRNTFGAGVACRGLEQLPPADRPACASWVLADNPGWYLAIRPDGLMAFQPEYDPTSPDTFDLDASIIGQPGYFPGFVSFGFASRPGRQIYAAADGFLRLSEPVDTPEFKDSASGIVIQYHTKGQSARHHCMSAYLL